MLVSSHQPALTARFAQKIGVIDPKFPVAAVRAFYSFPSSSFLLIAHPPRPNYWVSLAAIDDHTGRGVYFQPQGFSAFYSVEERVSYEDAAVASTWR